MCDSPFLSFKFAANGKKFKTIPWPLAANHQPLKIFPSGPQLLYNPEFDIFYLVLMCAIFFSLLF